MRHLRASFRRSPTVRSRQPSTFSSNTQPGWWKGRFTSVAAIGALMTGRGWPPVELYAERLDQAAPRQCPAGRFVGQVLLSSRRARQQPEKSQNRAISIGADLRGRLSVLLRPAGDLLLDALLRRCFDLPGNHARRGHRAIAVSHRRAGPAQRKSDDARDGQDCHPHIRILLERLQPYDLPLSGRELETGKQDLYLGSPTAHTPLRGSIRALADVDIERCGRNDRVGPSPLRRRHEALAVLSDPQARPD